MMIVQVDNRNKFMSLPLVSNETPERLRNMYGEQIEGERVVVYENDNTKHAWNYHYGKYVVEE